MLKLVFGDANRDRQNELEQYQLLCFIVYVTKKTSLTYRKNNVSEIYSKYNQWLSC